MNNKSLNSEQALDIENIYESLDFSNDENIAAYTIDKSFPKHEGRYGMVLKLKSKPQNGYKIESYRAIKFLKPEKFNKQPDSLQEFLRETQILSTLNHPNIPKIYESGTAKYINGDNKINIPYYIMEFIEGKTLKEMIDDQNEFSLNFLISLMGQILDTIKSCYLKEKPILHLDIKPDNILVYQIEADKYRFYLTDFGKGKIIQNSTDSETYMNKVGGGEFKYVHPFL